jgi:ABC-type Mn2+/Zn2+ transport system ATPase subunit
MCASFEKAWSPLSDNPSLIRFDHARLGYGKRAVLDGVDCAIQRGSFVGIVGPNGAGKTTFLNTALGLIPPLAGSVKVDRSRPFAYVPQIDKRNLMWPMTVREIVQISLRAGRLLGSLSDEDERSAEWAIDRAGVADLADRPLRALSGGQRQRALLAQALARRPEALLLDEPTQGLDVVAERDFLDLLLKLHKEESITILFVTHTLASALNCADALLLFTKGKVVATTPDELARTDRLTEIYGIPFHHRVIDGVRWVFPESKP